MERSRSPLRATSPLLVSSPRHSPLPSPTHLRQRSITLENQALFSPTESVFSNSDTMLDMGDEGNKDFLTEKGGHGKYGSFSAASASGEEETDKLTGDLGWDDRLQKEKKQRRRRCGARLCCLAMIMGVGLAGWAVGHASRQPAIVDAITSQYYGGEAVSSDVCDPYAQPGVLLVNTSLPSGNMWAPIAAPESCQPVDYNDLILQSHTKRPSKQIDFLRNKTIVLFGDSVDRYHNHHLCEFAAGRIEMIGSDHEMSPPYPKGREIPPEGYKNPLNGEREWPNFDQSRPFICHFDNLNLRILNVFHYGYMEIDDWIANHKHFYPPAMIEDRFDQIIVPLVASISEKYHADPTPDVISVTSGYWGLFRYTFNQDQLRDQEIAEGVSEAEALYKYDSFRNMNQEKRDWLEKRTREVLRHIAKGWRKEEKEEVVQTRPEILWRTLHHLNAQVHHIPFDRIQSLDQIGRSVVNRLVAEGRAAEEGQVSWAVWTRKAKEALGFKAERIPETEWQALHGGLGERLRINEWGRLILGQENHFIDDVHPKALPGSYLYSNMLFEYLKEAVDRMSKSESDW